MIDFKSTIITVDCPVCGKKLNKPEKKIENSVFCIGTFKCPQCGNQFKASC